MFDLRYHRELHRLPRHHLAEAAGVSSSFIAQVERGERQMPEERLERLKSLLALGAPEPREDEIVWVLHVDDPIVDERDNVPVFRSLQRANQVADSLRAIGLPAAQAVPWWRSSLPGGLDGTTLESSSYIVDEADARTAARLYAALAAALGRA